VGEAVSPCQAPVVVTVLYTSLRVSRIEKTKVLVDCPSLRLVPNIKKLLLDPPKQFVSAMSRERVSRLALLSRVFAKYDTDKSDTISAKELERLLEEFGGNDIWNKRQRDELMASLDKNSDDHIDLQEFIAGFSELVLTKKDKKNNSLDKKKAAALTKASGSLKHPRNSLTQMIKIVGHEHCDAQGVVRSGQVLLWADMCALACAWKHTQQNAVNSGIDTIHYFAGARLGEAIKLRACINRVFGDKMEIQVDVFASDQFNKGVVRHLALYISFYIALEMSIPDPNDPQPRRTLNRLQLPDLVPQSPAESERFDEAENHLQQRKQRMELQQHQPLFAFYSPSATKISDIFIGDAPAPQAVVEIVNPADLDPIKAAAAATAAAAAAESKAKKGKEKWQPPIKEADPEDEDDAKDKDKDKDKDNNDDKDNDNDNDDDNDKENQDDNDNDDKDNDEDKDNSHGSDSEKQQAMEEEKEREREREKIERILASILPAGSSNGPVGTGKGVHESFTEMTEIVLSSDATPYQTCHSGQILYWMDTIGYICAQNHTQQRVLAVSLDDVFFQKPVFVGELVILSAIVTRVFNSSIEVMVEVLSQDRWSSTKRLCCFSYLTFVAVNEQGEAVSACGAIATNSHERLRYIEANERRKTRIDHKLHLLKKLILQNFQEPDKLAKLSSKTPPPATPPASSHAQTADRGSRSDAARPSSSSITKGDKCSLL